MALSSSTRYAGGPSVRQDLAKLDKDPDTRRTAMDALKGYVEQLDVKSMPYFLDQVSSETKDSEASRTYAISLFVEVARVHKHLMIPYVPRIMSTVVRSLPSSVGSQNLQQACAKVVAAVARYAVDPTRSSLQNEEILASLCDPLLGVLCSKVEPLAVGAAACLQALVESEKWKFAAPGLVNDVCQRGTAALAEKGTQTVAHMQLLRSLAKFNASVLQDYGAQLLKGGVEILRAAGGTSGSWQQRAAAAHLLSSVLRAVDERTLASELGGINQALEDCRLDKVTVVRSAIGEALNTVKSLAPDFDLMQISSSEEALAPSPRVSDSRKRGRRRSLWRAGESCQQMKHVLSGSQESQVVSYTPSPTSSTTPSFGSASTPSTASTGTRMKRSPLYPAKQSPAKLTPPSSRVTVDSDLEYILAHLKSSESKENAPLMGKCGASTEPPISMRSDDLEGLANVIVCKEHHLSDLHHNGHKEDRDDDGASGFLDSSSGESFYNGGEEKGDFLAEEGREILYSRDGEVDSQIFHHGGRDLREVESLPQSRFRNGEAEKGCRKSLDKTSGDQRRGFLRGMDQENDFDCRGNCFENVHSGAETSEDESKSASTTTRCTGNGAPHGGMDHLLMSNAHYNSVAHLVNLEEAVSPQTSKIRMKADDFLLFTTPRRLVRSLQSGSSTPESRGTPECNSREGVDMDIETLSESGWSVRDNPIAGDSEEDSPKESVLVNSVCQRDMMTASLEMYSVKGSTSDGLEDILACQDDAFLFGKDSTTAGLSVSSGNSVLLLEDSGRCQQSNDADLLEPRDCDTVKMAGHMHGTTGNGNSDWISLSTRVAEEDSSKGKREKGASRWLRCVGGDIEWSMLARRWNRIQCCAEMFLGGALCVVLVFPMAIATINYLNGQQDIHVLVPT